MAVAPGIGDTIREPKWIWLWGMGGLQILLYFFWPRSPIPTLRGLPLAFLVLGIYATLQTALLLPFAMAWPVLLGLLSLGTLGLAYAAHPPEAWDKWLAWATWGQLVLALLQVTKLDPLFRPSLSPASSLLPVGFLGQHTIFGAWISAMAWYWFGRRNALFLFCSLAAFSTASAFTILAWLTGLIAWLFWSKRPLAGGFALFTLVGGSLAGLAYGGDFFLDHQRFLAWRFILSAALQRPWFGYGLGSFAFEFPAYHQGFSGPVWLQAHNEYLELFFDCGLVGLALGLATLAALWFRRKAWWRKEECRPWFLALTALLANSLGNFPLHIAPMALLATIAYLRCVREPGPPS